MENPQINLYAIIGKQQVQIEYLTSQLQLAMKALEKEGKNAPVAD